MATASKSAISGPYWISTATNGEHLVCGRNAAVVMRYRPDQPAMAQEHCRRLQKGFTQADKRIREEAHSLLAALELLISYEPGGSPPLSIPRGIAIDRARAAIAAAHGEPMTDFNLGRTADGRRVANSGRTEGVDVMAQRDGRAIPNSRQNEAIELLRLDDMPDAHGIHLTAEQRLDAFESAWPYLDSLAKLLNP